MVHLPVSDIGRGSLPPTDETSPEIKLIATEGNAFCAGAQRLGSQPMDRLHLHSCASFAAAANRRKKP
jgi:hypothetical protein